MKNCGVSAKRKKRPAKEKVGGNRARTTPGRGVAMAKSQSRFKKQSESAWALEEQAGAESPAGSIQLSVQ
jgi:hypothetical protein